MSRSARALGLLLLLAPGWAAAQGRAGYLPPQLATRRAEAWELAQRARAADMAGLAERVLEGWLAVAPDDGGFRRALGYVRDPILDVWRRGAHWQDGHPQAAQALELQRAHQQWRNRLVEALRDLLEPAAHGLPRPRILDALRRLGAELPARRVTLEPVTIDPAELTLGLGVTGVLPNWALSFHSDPFQLWLLDLDEDGVLTPGRDGLALAHGCFVVRLPQRLLLPEGQCRLALLPGEVLELQPEALDLPLELVRHASALTELRLRAGVPPVLLDVEASRACRLHLDYLALNQLTDGRAGLGIHDEQPELPGYSAAGAEAGRDSCLYPQVDSLSTAIYDWYATPFHGAPLVSPSTHAAGVAFAYGVAALEPSHRSSVLQPFVHPRPGARGVPTYFNARGEVPNPAPGTRFGIGCGYPVFVELPRSLWTVEPARVTLEDADGQALEGYVSSPATPAAPEAWPTNSGLLLFVPQQPLERRTTYQAHFALADGTRWSWSFTTAD